MARARVWSVSHKEEKIRSTGNLWASDLVKAFKIFKQTSGIQIYMKETKTYGVKK